MQSEQNGVNSMGYTVVNGRIKDPGKFEGEMDYVPHFWEMGLDGYGTDDGKIISVPVTGKERLRFPRLGPRRKRVRMYEDDQGFVHEVR